MTPLTAQQLDEIEAVVNAASLIGADIVPETARVLLAEVRRLTADLTEMTHCRDNALRALYRDDVETDIDLEETIAAPFYGPGWDWDDAALHAVVKEAASAVRPAFGKLTQQLAAARARVAELEEQMERWRRTAYQVACTHEPDAPRTLTEGEYSAAWHAVEGAAGEEGADPATVLHAVLDRLGINPPARPAL